jgi:hypothetical protein
MKTLLISSLAFIASVFSVSAQVDCISTGVNTNWSSNNTWTCPGGPDATRNVIILPGHTVNFPGQGNQALNIISLTIQDGGTLDLNRPLTISGDFIVNGTYSGTGDINLTGINRIIGGTGTITNNGQLNITNNKTIPALVGGVKPNLTKLTGNLVINSSAQVTNNAEITLGGNLVGTAANSTWINAANSTLSVGGTPADTLAPDNVPILLTGTLVASAPGNTVNYYSSSNITLKIPAADGSGLPAYHHLTLSGSELKTLPNAEIAVNGNVTINSNLNGNGTLKILHVRGNWINNSGVFREGFGTVIFDGASDQTISCAGCGSNPEVFNNLTLNKGNNSILKLNLSVKVGSSYNSISTLRMIQGAIETGAHTLSLGRITGDNPGYYSGALDYQGGAIIGNFQRGIYDGSAIGGQAIFPVGTKIANTVFSRPSLFIFNSISTSGPDRWITVNFNTNYPGNAGLPLADNSAVPVETVYNTFRDGFWSVTKGNGIGAVNYNLELTGNGFTAFPTINSTTRIVTRSTSGANWTLSGVHGTNTGNTVKRSNNTLLPAQFALGDITNCTAPITPDIVGSANVCKDDLNSKYSVAINETPESIYTWTVVGGSITNEQTLNGNREITVNWGSVGMVGSVSVLEKNACTEGITKILPVNIRPVPPSSIVGRINVAAVGTSTTLDETYNVFGSDNYQWSVNAPVGTIQGPTVGSSVNVRWVNSGTGLLTVTTSNSSCPSKTELTTLNVNVYKTIKSRASSAWNSTTTSTWDCNCIPTANSSVIIRSGDNVTIDLNGGRSVRNLIVEAGGSLSTSTQGNDRKLDIYGQLILNGTITGSHPVNLYGTVLPQEATLEGTGVISNTSTLNFLGNRTILSGTNITKATGDVTLATNIIVQNTGKFTIGQNLTGASGSQWVNKDFSTLEVGGTLLATGSLDASAPGNTVAYTGAAAQTLKVPVNNQYVNLSFTGAGSKTIPTLSISGTITNASPTTATGTLTFNGISSLLGSTPLNLNNLVIDGVLTSSPATVNVGGNFTNNNTFNHNEGTVVFNGTGAASIGGTAAKTTFRNITLSKTGSLSVERPVDLLGLLSVTNGTLDADGTGGAGVFTLVSNALGDARIGPMTGGSIVGDVTFQRYYESATTGRWRNFGFPVTNITRTQLGSSIPLAPNSLAVYDESVAGNLNLGWVYVNSGTLNSTKGHTAWMYNANPRTITLRGPLLSQTLAPYNNYGITFTDNGPPADAGWNFIPNPYASPIDWNAAGWTKTNVNSVAAIWDNSAGIYRYSNTGPFVIAQGQAFWIQANAANPSLVSTESVKVDVNDPAFYRMKNESVQSMLIVRLKSKDEFDETYIRFKEGANKGFDNDYDARKLSNAIYNLSTLTADGTSLAVNTLPKVWCTSSVKLNITHISAGNYTLSFEGFESFNNLNSLVLTDKYLDKTLTIKPAKGYLFHVTSDSRSYGSERFELTFDFTDPSLIPVLTQKGNVLVSSSEYSNQWYFNDEPIPGANQKQFAPSAPGTYYVMMSKEDCNLRSESLTITEGFNRIYPNPASLVLSVNVTNLFEGAGSGEIVLHNIQGQAIRMESFSSEDFIKELNLNGVAPGVYIVSIIQQGGKEVYKLKVIVQ